jgi:RHS repeat-associated protein
MVWDEDDRLQSVTDNSGQPTTFKYDDNTNRVIKKGAGGETLYVNPWYVAALGRNSKQIFAGATRIVSKLETFPSGEGYGTGAKNLTEVYQYFYHQDHLGSTGYVSDATGEVYQHLEYFPFGETWVDEVADDARVPYRFTGQEYDPETRLYYYGARYYDPRTSVWQSMDPALGKSLADRSGRGVFTPQRLALAAYAGQNPLRFIDPNGADWYDHYFRDSWESLRDGVYNYGALSTSEKINQTVGAMAGVAPPLQEFGLLAKGAGTVASGANELALQVAARYPTAAMFVTSIVAAEAGVVLNTPSGTAQNIASRTFQSADPLVGKIATSIEEMYPGHVVGVNVPLYNSAGKLVTDADILLQNAILQIKSGGGKGLADQLARTQLATSLPVIGFGPTLKGSVVAQVQREGGYVTTNLKTLLEVVKPDPH